MITHTLNEVVVHSLYLMVHGGHIQAYTNRRWDSNTGSACYFYSGGLAAGQSGPACGVEFGNKVQSLNWFPSFFFQFVIVPRSLSSELITISSREQKHMSVSSRVHEAFTLKAQTGSFLPVSPCLHTLRPSLPASLLCGVWC